MRTQYLAGFLVIGMVLVACDAPDKEAPLLPIKTLINDGLQMATSKRDYNAIITLNDNALAQATTVGRLAGMTLVVKDNIDVAGLPTTGGTEALRNHVATSDASVITRLRAEGAIILAKANMHELAFGITSNNAAYGAVRNAINPDYLPGGSSGGTAVAIALGISEAGLGTDTGGSSRIPAALNGLVGFRPTTGRYPSDGLLRISSTRDTVGPMGASVALVSILDSVMSGDAASIEYSEASELRIGVPRGYFYENLDPAVALIAEATLSRLAAAGVTLVDVDLSAIPALNEQIGFPIVFYETPLTISQYLADSGAGVSVQSLRAAIASPDVKGVIDLIFDQPVPETAYQQVMTEFRPKLQQAYADAFAEADVQAVIYPTTPLPARPRANSDATVELNGEQVPTFPTYIRNVDPSSNAGIPSISLPAGLSSDGLPIGMALDGPVGTDRDLLSVAATLEAILSLDE